jgi:malonyl-CoA O-methyltransferase
MLKQAQAKLPLHNIAFKAGDLTQPWPCGDASFDLVVCNLVLEHIDDISFVFAEAARCLRAQGRFFISELHPFKQYLGSKAGYRQELEIPVFMHHISDYLEAGRSAEFNLSSLREWWDGEPDAPPRLVSFVFAK